MYDSGHGAKLTYASPTNSSEKVTYQAMPHFRLRLVQVALYNLVTSKTKVVKLKVNSHTYTNFSPKTKSDIEYFDICAAKS